MTFDAWSRATFSPEFLRAARSLYSRAGIVARLRSSYVRTSSTHMRTSSARKVAS